jgi:hypothetical protein
MPKGNTINKKQVLVPAITAALVMMAPMVLSTSAFAIAPETTTKDRGLHFVGSPDLTVNKVTDENGIVTSASLSATGEVAGAGTGGEATLSATAEVTQGCLTNEPPGNPGGGQNAPSGLQTTDTTVTGSDTFTTTNGRGTFDVTTEAITTPTEDFSCPSAQQTEVLVGVTFTDITLTITTNEGKTITATFADQDP